MSRAFFSRESVKFGGFIRRLRLQKFPDISLNRFAPLVGISGSYLSAVETGKVPPPSAEVVIRLAEKLGVGKEYLLAVAGQPNQALKDLLVGRKYSEIRQMFMERCIGQGLVRYDFPEIAAILMGYKSEPGISTAGLLRLLADLVEAIEKEARPEVTPDLIRASLVGLLNYVPDVESVDSPHQRLRTSSRDEKGLRKGRK